jgi:hypothetical protein
MADPTDPTQDPADAPDPSAADAAPADDSSDDAGSPVLLTVLYDSSTHEFTLIQGDEDDDSGEGDDTGGGDAAGAGEGAEGAPPAAGGVAAAPKGQTFDSPGPLMKAIMEMVKDAQGEGGADADASFAEGYNGSTSPTPKS